MRWILSLLVAFAAIAPAPAAAKTSELCLHAIAQTERREVWLPSGLLHSIALVESGYSPPDGGWVPWPWTINSPAGSFYLDSRREAIAKVEELQRRGISNIDVGCMQINLHFHPDAFNSLDEAFRPASNVAYAARFLEQLYGAHRDLFQAVGRYHSATPKRRDAYARKVFARWDKDTGIELPSRHGLGAPATPRITRRETGPDDRTTRPVWRNVYGEAPSGPAVIQRSGTGSWLGTSRPRVGAQIEPTQPRNAGQILLR